MRRPMARTDAEGGPGGLADLKRSGAVTALLFLYECGTKEPTQLQPIADRLGLTVQAASHQFRQLAARGLAELRDGHYRPTVAGVAWLHGALGRLRDDVNDRLARLYVVRRVRAVAGADLARGAPVCLELRDGILVARPGTGGGSTGRARSAARHGGLVEVDRLEGILPLTPAPVRILVLPSGDLGDRGLSRAVARSLGRRAAGLFAAQGLEALHLARRAAARSWLRFGVGAACREASRVGVASTVLVLDAELPRLLAEFGGPEPPPLEVSTVRVAPARQRRPQRR